MRELHTYYLPFPGYYMGECSDCGWSEIAVMAEGLAFLFAGHTCAERGTR